MPSTENITIPISKAAVVVVAICGFIATVLIQYYTTQAAITAGFNNMKSEIQDLRNTDKIMQIDINGIRNQAEFNASRIEDIEEFIKPDPIVIKPRKR